MKIFQFVTVFFKTTTGLKPFCTRLHKIDGFIIALDGKIKHLIVFDYGLFNRIFGKIKCLISKKSGIRNSINNNFGQTRIDSYDSLTIKKILIFHNVKPVVNKNKNKCQYNIFLEKGSYKDK